MKTKALKISCSRPIMDNALACFMLLAIQLNDQLRAATIEIHNVSGKLFLAAKLYGMSTKKTASISSRL